MPSAMNAVTILSLSTSSLQASIDVTAILLCKSRKEKFAFFCHHYKGGSQGLYARHASVTWHVIPVVQDEGNKSDAA